MGGTNNVGLGILDKNANVVKHLPTFYKGQPEIASYEFCAQGKVFCTTFGPAIVDLETGEIKDVEYPSDKCYSTEPRTYKVGGKAYFGNLIYKSVYSEKKGKMVMFGKYVYPYYNEKLKLSYISAGTESILYLEDGTEITFSEPGDYELLPDGSAGKKITLPDDQSFELKRINFTKSYEDYWFAK